MTTLRFLLLSVAAASLAAPSAFAQSETETDDLAAGLAEAMSEPSDAADDDGVSGFATGELPPAEETEQEEVLEGDLEELPPQASITAEDAEGELARVSAYINDLDTMSARFIQIAADGSIAEGSLYIDRPGRARFEYDEPHPSLIVADGDSVAHFDRELETIDRIPLRQTPLHLLLGRNVDVAEDADILDVTRSEGALYVTAADPTGDVDGQLTLVFTTPVLELREWIVLDGLGQRTIITLTNIERGGDFDRDLFEIEDDRRPSDRRRGG